MNGLTRRQSFASLLGGVFALAGTKSTLAQSTQTTANGASIVATGDVHLGQSASASQTVRGAGTVSGTGIQVVTNDGRIVATGDVWVNQEAAASQVIERDEIPTSCVPGEFWTFRGDVYFCDSECNVRTVDCGCKGRCR